MISFYLEMSFVNSDPSPCTSHIMCGAFFIKFQDNTCRNKVDKLIEAQKLYILIEHRYSIPLNHKNIPFDKQIIRKNSNIGNYHQNWK